MNLSNSNDILSKILEKELELESNCTMEVLNSLVITYREAIEHFENIKSPKLYDYQERLQKILMRPLVLNIMQAEHAKNRNEKRAEIRSQARKSVLLQQASKHNRSNTINEPFIDLESLSISSVTEPSTPRVIDLPESPKSIQLNIDSPTNDKAVNRIVDSQFKRTETVIGKTVSHIKAQENSLNERLKKRCRKGLADLSVTNASFSKQVASLPQSPKLSESFSQGTKEFRFANESDKSGGVNVFSILHEKIEKIMEESFTEKTERITEVKVRYRTQIAELESEGGIYEGIVKEMKKNMSKEIEEISKEVDFNRKNRINEAKKELGLLID